MSDSAPIPQDTARIWADFHEALRRFVASRITQKADADDVMQEIFLRIHNKSADIRDNERVAGWVFRIASNAVTDHFRRHSRAPDVPQSELPEPIAEHPLSAAEEDLAACVRPFVDMLDEPYREALRLTELKGLTQAEAAKVLGISHSGMKSRVQRGKKLLRGELESCCEVTLDGRNRVVDYTPRDPCAKCGPDC